MGLYTFALEQVHLDNTRSRHQDTDTVVCGLQVGSRQFPVQSFFAGDVNNGDHALDILFADVFISDSRGPVVLSYQIYNGDTSQLPVSLATLNKALTSQLISQLINNTLNPPAEPSSPADETDFPSDGSNEARGDDPFQDDSTWFQGLTLGLVALGEFLFPDCDGFVAANTRGGTKAQWDALIDSTGGLTFRQATHFPGTDSPAGCGSNSDYTATWSVTRELDYTLGPHSLWQFLQDHQAALDPGIRSLDPTASRISLRELMGLA